MQALLLLACDTLLLIRSQAPPTPRPDSLFLPKLHPHLHAQVKLEVDEIKADRAFMRSAKKFSKQVGAALPRSLAHPSLA